MQSETFVKKIARDSGFDLCGVARAEPVPGLSFFDLWLKRGLDGPLAYLKKHRGARADPSLVLPGVKSVICLARTYLPPPQGLGTGSCVASKVPVPNQDQPLARIASYAGGEDYHVSLKRDMEALALRIKKELIPDFEFRIVADSAPVLERSYAQAAGLGWIGKNTCLIHPEKGSFFLLGEILTTAELSPDENRVEDQCGACTACLDACPTGALVEAGVMDASRCISTLTLEQKGVLPEALLPKMENWIAGCDVCQEVCPFNQEKRDGEIGRLGDTGKEPQLATPSPLKGEGREGMPASEFPLAEFLSLTLPEIRARFKGSAVLRAKPAMLMRNALVAAGNSGDAGLKPLVAAKTQDPDAGIASAARWAFKVLSPPPAGEG